MRTKWLGSFLIFAVFSVAANAQILSPANAPRISQTTLYGANGASQCNPVNNSNPNDFQPGQRTLIINGVNFTAGPFGVLPVLYIADERIGPQADNPAITLTDT